MRTLKISGILVAMFLTAFLIVNQVHAQIVPAQNQVTSNPYGGLVYATSTSPTAKLYQLVGSALGQIPSWDGLKWVVTATSSLGIPNYWTSDGAGNLYNNVGTRVGVGTTTPFANLSVSNVATTPGNAPLFVLASTTAGNATTTIFQINPAGGLGGGGSFSMLFNGIGGIALGATNAVYNVGNNGGITWNNANSKIIGNSSTQSLIFSNNALEAGRFQSSKLGIGTTSPIAALSVSTTTQSNGILPLFMVASSTNATLFTVLGNGNVGIGTTSPMSQLSITGVDTLQPQLTIAYDGSNFSTFRTSSSGSGVLSTGSNLSLNAGGTTVALQTGGTTRFSITNGALSASSANGPRMTNATGISTTAPTLIPSTADTSTGFAAGTSGNINAIVGGVETSRWTGTSLGIGTTSPAARLGVGGGAYIGGNLTATGTIAFTGISDGCLNITSGVVGSTGVACGAGGGGSGGGTWATTTSTVAGQLINYSLNNTDIVTVGSTSTTTAPMWFDPNALVSYFKGKVGIGTTSPASNLHIFSSGLGSTVRIDTQSASALAVLTLSDVNTSAGSSNIYYTPSGAANSNILSVPNSSGFQVGTGGTGGFWFNVRAAAPIVFATGGNGFSNERMRVDGAGLVGIGTTTPFAKLSVNGVNAGTGALFAVASSTASGASTTAFMIDGSGNTSLLNGSSLTIAARATPAGAFAAFDTSGTLIATTSPQSALTFGNLTSGTGLTITGGTGAVIGSGSSVSAASGYSIPLTASTTDWNTAYLNRITSANSPLVISSNAISFTPAADISWNSHKITSLLDPTSAQDAATKNYVDTAVTGLLDYRGSYDASTNLYPATGGSGILGAVAKGDFWITSVAGTLGGVAVTPGDLIIALVDIPGQTASNWDLIPHNLGNYITSIGPAGQLQTGPTITLATSTTAFNGLTSNLVITASGNTQTFSTSFSGTLGNAGLTNSTISGKALGTSLEALTATNGSLTFSGSFDGSTARTIGLNVGNANTWTGLQIFANASSTNQTDTNLWLPPLGTAAGAFLAVDAAGKVIATTTPSGSSSGSVGTGTTGQMPYYASDGTALTATSSIFISANGYIGIGSTSPWASLSIQNSSVGVPLFSIATSSDDYGHVIYATATTSVFTTVSNAVTDAIKEIGIRISLGAVKYLGGPLLDQFTVNGRVNTQGWGYLGCDQGGTLTVISTVAAGNNACGSWSYGETEPVSGVNMTLVGGSGYLFQRVNGLGSAGNVGGLFAAGVSTGWLTAGTSTPVMEATARFGSSGAVTYMSTSTAFIGFGSFQANGPAAIAPADGCYFTASSTQANWRAICRASSVETNVDTGVASTTDTTIGIAGFRRFRVELDNTHATFYIQNTQAATLAKVANITTNIPTTVVNAAVYAGNAGTAAAGTPVIDFYRLRLWYRDILPTR